MLDLRFIKWDHLSRKDARLLFANENRFGDDGGGGGVGSTNTVDAYLFQEKYHS